MSHPAAHSGGSNDAAPNQVYHFGANPFLIWNDEVQDFGERGNSQWQYDYSFLPQMPRHPSPPVLKDIANLSDNKSPTTTAAPLDHGYLCNTLTSQGVATNLDISEGGLRIDNLESNPGQVRASNALVPAIITQPATRNNTVDESHESQQAPEGLHAPHVDPMQYQYNITPPNVGYAPGYMNDPCHSASSLQEAFQFHSPGTRRNSVSSCNSGPVFSHYGTPISTHHHESVMGTPYSMQHQLTPQSNSYNRLPQWSPRSPTATWKPQSRKQNSNSFSRMSQEYINALHRQRGSAGISMTMPSRRKPRIEHSLSESSLFNDGPNQINTGGRSAEGRKRAASVIGPRSSADTSSMQSSTQLQLPMFQPDQIFASPVNTQSSFATPDPNIYTMAAPANLSPHYPMRPYESQHQISPPFNTSMSNSQPPLSDFQDKPHPQIPVFQPPQFPGDIYTPQYKRRNEKGEWEGWCGLCQPGQWHNLKNSRYWDDKLRNHGICARTKRKFDDPVSLRVIGLDGSTVNQTHEMDEIHEPRDDWVVSGLDGSLRKREGLCGYCSEWIPMDGIRSKGKGKSVGWWSHAYKCHEQGRKVSPSDQADKQMATQPQLQPSYHTQTHEQIQQALYANQHMGFPHHTNQSYNN